MEKLSENCTETYVHIQSLSQMLSGTWKNERYKPTKKGNKCFKTNSTCIGFITFDKLVTPALVCLGYLYLFPSGHICNIFLIQSNPFENLVIFCQLQSDDLYFEPAC